tara:strand:+ start:2368 stop:3588 length:1221 start_codon:yes stop_codon:yes gene_type:complete
MALTGLTNLQPLHIKTVGIGTFDNTVSIGGTLTYEDVTNVDAIGIITARSGVNVSGGQLDVGSNIKLGNAGVITATSFVGSGSGLTGVDTDLVNDSSPQLGGALDVNGNNINFGDSSGSSDDRLKFGASNDMVIYHDGTRNIIDSQSSQLRIETDALRLRSDAGETYLEADANAALKIYHNNALKFDTVSTGIRVHGDEGGTAQLQLLADQGDDNPDYWRFIAETNGVLNIQDYGSGNWYNNIRLTGSTGGVELYHDNSKKFETGSDHVTVTGSGNDAAGISYIKIKSGNGSHRANIGKLSSSNGRLSIMNLDNDSIFFGTSGSNKLELQDGGHLLPVANNSYDLGQSSYRWRNIYTNDLNLSNKGSTNSVDNTWGDFTIQEGESDLFLINNRNGKKYKFNLTEVS